MSFDDEDYNPFMWPANGHWGRQLRRAIAQVAPGHSLLGLLPRHPEDKAQEKNRYECIGVGQDPRYGPRSACACALHAPLHVVDSSRDHALGERARQHEAYDSDSDQDFPSVCVHS